MPPPQTATCFLKWRWPSMVGDACAAEQLMKVVVLDNFLEPIRVSRRPGRYVGADDGEQCCGHLCNQLKLTRALTHEGRSVLGFKPILKNDRV